MVAGSFNAAVARGERVDEVTVSLESPGATVADLLTCLGIDEPNLLIDDDQVVPGDHALVEVALRDGAVLRGTARDARRPAGRPARLALEVVGGPDSGHRAEVPAGTYEIGRSRDVAFPLASEAVSAVHATLEVDEDGGATIDDRASFNGTWVNGVQVRGPTPLGPEDLVRLGNAELRVRPIPDDAPRLDRSGHLPSATLPFNRPPRTAVPEPVPAVVAPEAPRPATRTSPLSIFAIIGPLLFAGVMVLVLGNIRFAVFAILSPIIAVGTFVDNRRRGRKTSRKDAARFAEEVTTLRPRARRRRGAGAAAARGRVAPSGRDLPAGRGRRPPASGSGGRRPTTSSCCAWRAGPRCGTPRCPAAGATATPTRWWRRSTGTAASRTAPSPSTCATTAWWAWWAIGRPLSPWPGRCSPRPPSCPGPPTSWSRCSPRPSSGGRGTG